MIPIWIFMAALAIVALLAWIITRLKYSQKILVAESELKTAQKLAEDLKADSRQLAGELKSAEQENTSLKEKSSALQSRLEEKETNLREQIDNLEKVKQQLKLEFENLAQRIFEDKSAKFSEKSKEQISTLLSPLQTQITEFRQKVEEIYVKEGQQRFNLTEQIKLMHSAYETLSLEANNLVRAFKADTKAQGDWGEFILGRILENSGLQEGIHYKTQAQFRDEENRGLRPDVIIQLPGERQIIVDSKVSIKAYEQYYNAVSDKEREEALKAHVQSIRTHIKELAAKKYDYIKELTTLDFVFMFVPLEAAFMAALDRDRELFTEAYDQRVLLVCPSTLLVTLQMVNSIWKVEYQNRNSRAIADQGASLLEKFAGFLGNLEEIQKHLLKSQDACRDAMSQLTSGRGNLLSQAEKLLSLGVKVNARARERISSARFRSGSGEQPERLEEQAEIGENILPEDEPDR